MIKILIVDDQAIVRKQFATVVKEIGWDQKIELIEAGDGIEGIEQFEKYPDLNVLLVDVHLPRLDGVGMLTEIKKRFPQQFSQKIIFMVTAQSDSEQKATVKALGVNGWVLKPIDVKKFLTVILSTYFPVQK